jgi:hypothetical protein
MGAVLFSTTDYSGPRRPVFRKFLASLKRQEEQLGRLRKTVGVGTFISGR